MAIIPAGVVKASSMLRIAYLADHPEYIPELAVRHYGEWAHLYPGETLADFENHLRSSAQRSRLPLTVVALVDGEPAGSASLIAHDLESHPELSPWLANVHVAPYHRSKGIATALVKHILREAETLGIKTIYLFTTRSAEFYRRLGWRSILLETSQNEPITIMSRPMDQSLD